ncbi:hypothetical protein QYM36_006476, partial [Artemia franciscana]
STCQGMEEQQVKELQVRLATKQKQYSVPETPLSVPSSIEVRDLNSLVNGLIQESTSDWNAVDFDFLVNGEFLRLSLLEHLINYSIPTEAVVDIEYVERFPPPEPQDSLNHDDWVSAVVCSDKWIFSGCYDNTLQLWGIDGSHTMTIPAHAGPVKAIALIDVIDNTATLVSGSHDQTVMQWKIDLEKLSVDCVTIGKGHERSVECVSVDPTRTLIASGSWDTYLKIWTTNLDASVTEPIDPKERKRLKKEGVDSLTRTPLVTLSGHKEAVSGCVWTDNSEVCTCSWDHTIRLWDAQLGGIKAELTGNKSFFSLSWSSLNRSLLTSSADRHIRVYDPRSKEGSLVKATYTSHTGWVSSVKWSPTDENLFISGGHDGLLKLWDRRSQKASLYDMTGHEDKVLCCDWSNPLFMSSGSADNTLKVFKANNESS